MLTASSSLAEASPTGSDHVAAGGPCKLVWQASVSPCELGHSFGCDPERGSMWVANCRGEFRCGLSLVHCGYPPGLSAYNCSCSSSDHLPVGSTCTRQEAFRLPITAPQADSFQHGCLPSEAFALHQLPYRWLPGVPLRHLPPEAYYRNGTRFEVLHTFDNMSGPLWLYGAPGSGVWWNPGRVAVRKNLIDAVLSFNDLGTVVRQLTTCAHTPVAREAECKSRRAMAERWRAALGEASWEVIIRQAAAGHPCYGLISMAAGTLFSHLLPLRNAKSLLNRGVDSVILAEQMHLWPRPEDEVHGEWSGAASLVQSCCAGEPAPNRLHTVPEILELRVEGPSASELSRSPHIISAEESRSTPCRSEIPGWCTSCSRSLDVLCLCAKKAWRRNRMRFLKPHRFANSTSTFHECCSELFEGPQSLSAARSLPLKSGTTVGQGTHVPKMATGDSQAAPAAGVLHAALVLSPSGRAGVVRELIGAATHLRQLLRGKHALPIDLIGNRAALQAVCGRPRQCHPWDQTQMLRWPRYNGSSEKFAAYLFKLQALLRSRFRRTLYLDSDIVVVEPTLVNDLLATVLRVADIAMPLDPGRAAHLTIGGQAAPWVAPATTPPMLCSCMIAFRRSARVAAHFHGAVRRLTKGLPQHLRQSDQEALWFEWTQGGSTTLRVLALPEETYCPIESHQPAPQDPHKAQWLTSWRRGLYPCRAVHSHALAQSLRRAGERAANAIPPNDGQCELVRQTSLAACELGSSFGCDPASSSMWVANCRGTFRCAGRTVLCGYPPGLSVYNCSCFSP